MATWWLLVGGSSERTVSSEQNRPLRLFLLFSRLSLALTRQLRASEVGYRETVLARGGRARAEVKHSKATVVMSTVRESERVRLEFAKLLLTARGPTCGPVDRHGAPDAASRPLRTVATRVAGRQPIHHRLRLHLCLLCVVSDGKKAAEKAAERDGERRRQEGCSEEGSA